MTPKTNRRLFGGILCAVFVCLWLMTAFTPLHTDDYTYLFDFSTKSEERVDSLADLLPSAVAHYRMLNGRMVTHALFAQPMLLLGKPVFNLANAGAFVVFLLGLYLLVRGEKKWDWPLLLGLSASVFLFSPVFGIAVLWLDGSCNYLWGLTLIIYALLPFRHAVLEPDKAAPSPWAQGGYILLSLLAGNVSENMSLAMIGLMGLTILGLLWQKRRVSLYFFLMLTAAAAAYVFLICAPSVSQAIGSSTGLGVYWARFSDCMGKLLAQKWLLCAYVALLSLAWKDPALKERRWFSLGLVLCAVLANLSMVLPGRYPERATFGWVILLLAACGMLTPALAQWQSGVLWRGLLACLSLLCVITFLMVMPMNYERYRLAEAQVASALAQRDAGVSDVVIFGIKSRSKYDVFRDGVMMSADPTYRPNLCFARYYGLDSVALSQEVH